MPKPVTTFAKTEQPINWWRAFASGIFAASFMMALLDTFAAIGVTPFSFEMYLGTFVTAPYPHLVWLVGLFANWIVGGVFGLIYASIFEYGLKSSGAREGTLVAIGHILVSAIILFPAFNILHEFRDANLYPSFGVLGSGIGIPTLLLIIIGHFIYGSVMGLLYGPVRSDRVRYRDFEPGQSGLPGQRGVITEREDPEDRAAV